MMRGDELVNALAKVKSFIPAEKVEDIVEIMGYGVMRTPALVIDEKAKTSY